MSGYGQRSPGADGATDGNAGGPGEGAPGIAHAAGPGADDEGGRSGGRPIVERIGLAAIAAVLGSLFAFVAVVSWVGGEAFLAFMGVLGAGVTVWLAVRTILGR